MWMWLIGALVLTVLLGLGTWLAASHARFAQYHRHKGLVLRPASIGEHLAYYLREGLAHLVLATWHVAGLLSEGLRNPGGSARPVLLVHGFTQNATNFFGMRRRLERRGHPTWTVSLGRPLRPMDAHARRLVRALEAAAERFDGIDIVAHSMGGLVLRHVLAVHPHLARKVGRVVTLGAPHQGTAGARGVPALAIDLWQMRRGSDWLHTLPGFPDHVEVVTVAAERDFVVYPASTCHLPGAAQVELRGVGHAGLLTDRRAVEVVADALAPRRARRAG